MKSLWIAIFVLVSFGAAFSQDYAVIRGKLIKISIYKKTGAFFVERTMIKSEKENKQVLFVNNPPTSFWAIKVGDRVYSARNGTISTVEKVHLEDWTARGVWKAGKVFVYMKSEIVRNALSLQDDSACFMFTLSNSSSKPVNVGFKIVLDTVVGEDSQIEGDVIFDLENQDRVNTERFISSVSMPSYVRIHDSDGINNVFISYHPCDFLVKPDSLYLVNWKRLADAEWKPRVETRSYFRYSGYTYESQIDAAVGIFWENVELNPSSTKTVAVVVSLNKFAPEIEKEEKERVKKGEVKEVVVKKEQKKEVKKEEHKEKQVPESKEKKKEEVKPSAVPTSPVPSPAPTVVEAQVPEELLHRIDALTNLVMLELQRLQTLEKKKLEELEQEKKKLKEEKKKKEKEEKMRVALENLARMREKMLKLSECIEELNARSQALNYLISVKKKKGIKGVIYSEEDFRKDMEMINRISKLLDEVEGIFVPDVEEMMKKEKKGKKKTEKKVQKKIGYKPVVPGK